jgi:hypothetical protein
MEKRLPHPITKCKVPTKRSELREREPTDLERYGHWQDVLIFVGLVLLGVVIAKWVWGG